ncbi:MAG: hypothetical protein ACLRTA_01045 [Clostridia bacterium]
MPLQFYENGKDRIKDVYEDLADYRARDLNGESDRNKACKNGRRDV